MTMPLEPPPLTPEQQLAGVANNGGNLVEAAYLYIAQVSTWTLAGALAGLSDA